MGTWLARYWHWSSEPITMVLTNDASKAPAQWHAQGKYAKWKWKSICTVSTISTRKRKKFWCLCLSLHSCLCLHQGCFHSEIWAVVLALVLGLIVKNQVIDFTFKQSGLLENAWEVYKFWVNVKWFQNFSIVSKCSLTN